MDLVKLHFLRSLDIAAASGLLLLDDSLYVVADDENFVCQIGLEKNDGHKLIQLFPGKLPEEESARKALKPDLESLVYIPELESILAVPSGSKPNRIRGALVGQGKFLGEVGFQGLYSQLWAINPELNIEGAALWGDEVVLFSRGNGANHRNEFYRLDRADFVVELRQGGILRESSCLKQVSCSLGSIDACPLGFTDVCLGFEDELWFLAAAETGDSTYLDGAFRGAVIGQMDSSGVVQFQARLDCPVKPEGLAIDVANKKFFVVTDSDSRREKAQLFVGDLP